MNPPTSSPIRLPARWSLPPAIGLLLTAAISAQTVNLTVDTTQAVRTVDERVFGLNAVLWDSQTASAETLALVQAAGIHSLRIPGGGMSDDYNWANHTQVSTANAWPEGFNYFVPLITSLNPQTFVTVNYGSGTPQEAAAWVAYANADAALQGSAADVNLGSDANGFDWRTAGYWSALRASSPLATDDGRNFLRLNRPAPFGLRYWEVGNECYGTWEYDLQSAQHDPVVYGTRFAQYFAAMKAVDPTIKIGAVATTSTEGPYYNYPAEAVTDPADGKSYADWDHVMLGTIKAAGVMPDYLICHRYEQNAGQEDDATLLQLASDPHTGWLIDVAMLRGPLNDCYGAAAAKVELCVTENNSVHNNPGKQMTSLVNGLYLADSLGSLLQTEFNSRLWWDLRDGGPPTDGNGHLLGNQSTSLYGWRLYGDYGLLSSPSSLTGETGYYDAYPTYYVEKLLTNFVGGGDTVVHAATDNTLLAAYAAQRRDGSLSLLIINKSPTSAITGHISLAGFIPSATATVYSYGIPQDNAARTGSGSPDIATESLLNAAPAFPASFAPYSATVLSFQPAPPNPTISTQPISQTSPPGKTVTFIVGASSNPLPTYQWQWQASGTSTWANLTDTTTYSGTSTASLAVNAVAAGMNGDAFRCAITNSNGTATTAPAALVVDTSLTVVTFAGLAGVNGSTDGSGAAARFANPSDVAVDATGNLYVADTANHLVRKVTPAGVVSTLAGHPGVSGSADGTTAATFNRPAGVAVDSSGNVYVADTNNNAIRKVTAAGTVSTLAGVAGSSGSSDGTGTAASFSGPSGIVADAAGNLFVADTLNHTIRKVTSAGAVTTIAGTAGASGLVDAAGSAARFHGPQGLALDAAGDLYVADTNNNAIRKLVTATGAVSTVAGLAGTAGSTDGANSQARFHFPSGVAVDAAGTLYVADTDNHTLRAIAPTGTVSTLAGLAGVSGSSDGVGSGATFAFPTGVAVDGSGNVYVADTNNDTIRLAFTPVAPAITQQPQSQTVTAGANVSFSVAATGKPAPAYQWYFNGVKISSSFSTATESTLSLTNVAAAAAGNYTVTVTDSSGTLTSDAATLTVNTPPPPPPNNSGGGGGGAPSAWFCGFLGLLVLARWASRLPVAAEFKL